MANEINFSCSFRAIKSKTKAAFSDYFQADMTGDDVIDATQDIGTSAEAVTFGEISGNPKAVMIQNMDATNFVLVGFTNPPTEMKILAGEIGPIIGPQAAIYAKADTATVKIRKVACEI